MPIGAYHPAWPDIHMNPEEAVRAHLDVAEADSGLLVPIHWATFRLAPHPWAEPVERLLARRRSGRRHVSSCPSRASASIPTRPPPRRRSTRGGSRDRLRVLVVIDRAEDRRRAVVLGVALVSRLRRGSGSNRQRRRRRTRSRRRPTCRRRWCPRCRCRTTPSTTRSPSSTASSTT